MTYFSIITGATGLIHSRDVYRQADLYARADAVYAKYGAGFIRLGIGGATSAPNIRWADFDPGETAIITEKPGSPPKYQGERDSEVRAAE